MICDSTFFVALDRERARTGEGPMCAFVEAHKDEEIGMSVVTRGELARGFKRRVDWEAFSAPFRSYGIDDEVLWTASEIFRDLSGRGIRTGADDLWIAATAVTRGQSLATKNTRHFEKIRGLRVLSHP